jgi:protein TonB
MIRFIPFVLASGGVHVALCCLCGSLLLSRTGAVGSEHGVEPRLFVTVIAQEEVRAQAESPAQRDSVASQPAEPIREEKEETPEEQPEKTPEKEVVKESEQPTPSPDALVRVKEEIGPDAPILARATEKPASALIDRRGETSPEDDKGESPEAKEEAAEDEGTIKEKEETLNHPGQESSIASVAQSASRESQFRAARAEDLANFRDSLLAAIRKASYFPRKALRKRQHGETTVRFTVGRNGSVSGLAVVHSSGSELLDEAAVKIIGKAAKDFPPIPASISKDGLNYVVPIVFKKRRAKKK